jgi:hypothetical protein
MVNTQNIMMFIYRDEHEADKSTNDLMLIKLLLYSKETPVTLNFNNSISSAEDELTSI